MNNKKIQEQDIEKLPLRTQALIAIGGIQRDKLTSPDFIKNILRSSDHEAKSSGFESDGDDYNIFYTPGTNIDLDTDLKRIRDRIRFEEYGDSFKRGVETRGSAFEGMLAGLFNGETIPGNPKEDIKIKDVYYSIKQANPGDAWDTGSLMEGYNIAYRSMLNDNIPEDEIPTTPVSLMVAGENYVQYKAQMLTESFKTSKGKPLKWIFAHVLDEKRIEYDVMDSEELISVILSSDCNKGTGSQACAIGRSRKSDTGLRIKSRFVLGNPKIITFPSVTEDEIKSIIYDPKGERIEDKIRRIFKNPNKVSQYTVEYIKNNPKEFLNAVNKILPELTNEEKKIVHNLLVENTNIEKMTPKLWNLVRLTSSMLGEEAFVSRGGSIIDFKNVLKKYFNVGSDSASILWLIIQHNSQYYGISEKETVNLPLEKVKLPDTIYETNVEYYGSYESSYEEDPCGDDGVGEESGNDCNCRSASKEVEDNEGNTSLEECDYGWDDDCECVEWESQEIEMYWHPLLEDKTHTLFNPKNMSDVYDINDLYLNVLNNHEKEVIYILEKEEIEDGYEDRSTWDYFDDGRDGDIDTIDVEEIDVGRELGYLNRSLYGGQLTEETDLFGQGLLDPIEPEDFEGDEEEWDKLVDDLEEPEIEPTYDYQGGKTDASAGYVAPSSDVTDNICKVEGFCEEQGPITFGQLKLLVEEATSKRIKADIGRGIFKSLWRIVPFFVPQILLAAVGVTVTRAFNKIITPALKDTRGYKSWWGKAVLKAMDVAEGDYIPDVALGDDPLSKIFFISDGLMSMIKDKYKLKFARYVSEYASTRPNNEPVPDWFVENLLRDYLNQKFLLNPPLPVKNSIEKKGLNEQTEVDVIDDTKYEQFTKLEILIMNSISKKIWYDELKGLVEGEYYNLSSKSTDKLCDILKLFSVKCDSDVKTWTLATRFARWMVDNWVEAERLKEIQLGDDFDPSITYDLDFGLVKNPIKTQPKEYRVTGHQSGWQKEYKTGSIEIPAWDVKDAIDKAYEGWFDYDPDMETVDWGDYEDDNDLEINPKVELVKNLNEDNFNVHSLSGLNNLMVKAIFTHSGSWGKAPQKFIVYLTPTGIVKTTKKGDGMSANQIPFKNGDKVRLGDLIKYEKQSGFELQMVGRIHENTKSTRINKSIKTWINKEFNLVLDHNNVVTFLDKNTEKLNTYNQVNDLICEIWGKENNHKLNVHEFEIKKINIENKKYNNLLFENLNNHGVKLPIDTLQHYLNKNIKEEIKHSILTGDKINLNKLNGKLTKLGFIKENQPKQKVVLEWLNSVIKEINKNGVITEEGKIGYVDNLVETITDTPHGLGVPQEVFLSVVNQLKPDLVEELKPMLNDFMCEEVKWKITFAIKEFQRKLTNMGILEETVHLIPESLVNLYTQVYSEIDQRLKSSKEGMPVVNKEVQKLTEDNPRAHSYSGGKHTNPQDVEVGDVIRLIFMDDPQGIAVGSYGEVVGFDTDPWDTRILVTWELPGGKQRNLPLYPSIDTFMLHQKKEQINEQDNQISAFPTGQFEFTAHEDKATAKWLEKTVSEKVITLLFNKWDEEGINLKLFKYLGIPTGAIPTTYILKRYIRNTKKPIPVSHTFSCDDLTSLFDRDGGDYDMDYIEEYLCGKDKFWEPSEWFQYEWDDYMLDSINENNWKTISSIFGGASQEVAEHILSEQPQNEEEEELIEKYEEEISDIKHFIIWAHNDLHEDMVKSAMAEDIEDKLAEHFQEEGRLVTNDYGGKSWVIKGDLRDYVNDIWDNTEDVFQYHPDYSHETLEGVLMDFPHKYDHLTMLFDALIEEEYRFWDYCEGKRGECLQTDSKFFDGYWVPDYDINEMLADRLTELTYEPQVTTPEGKTKPLRENKNIPHWDLYQLLNRTGNVVNKRRKKVFDFLNVLQNLGLVNMYQSPDFLWSGSKWLTKYLDLYHPELLDEPDEDIEPEDDGYWDNEKIKQARYLLDNADTVRDVVLMMLMDSTEDQSLIKVETQMRPFALDLVKLWAQTK